MAPQTEPEWVATFIHRLGLCSHGCMGMERVAVLSPLDRSLIDHLLMELFMPVLMVVWMPGYTPPPIYLEQQSIIG